MAEPLSPLHLPLLLTLLFTLSTSLNKDGLILLAFKTSLTGDPLSKLAAWNATSPTPCSWPAVTCSPASGAGAARVTAVNLPNSRLSGPISPYLGLLDRLVALDLSGNSFNGSFPATFAFAKDLRVLDLSNNLLSGDLPEQTWMITNLQTLNLSYNSFTGELPGNLTGLGNLTVISLENNRFSGGIPAGLGQVQFLDVSFNLLNRSLPPEIGGQGVRYLNVSYNRISGEIPAKFGKDFPANATLDLSHNRLKGKIPDSSIFLSQESGSFSGNPGLCGKPLLIKCSISTPSPAAALIPPAVSPAVESAGIRPGIIVGIAAGSAGIAVLAAGLFYLCNLKRRAAGISQSTRRKNRGGETSSSASSETEETQQAQNAAFAGNRGLNAEQQRAVTGTLVTVEGETELELEALLTASAYVMGVSGSGVMYKAVLGDGTAVAVRRIGEAAAVPMRDFENRVRTVARLAAGHRNLVRIRGFYRSSDEKLVVYEFVPNGNLATFRYGKGGSVPRHMPWEIRLKIAKGLARGLGYLHDKKHVHGNIKPTNILLGLDMEPKITDFGLDRISPIRSGYKTGQPVGHFESHATASPSSSSIGCVSPYQPPESLHGSRPNAKWDVYSFGVVWLELLTGRVMGHDDLALWMTGLAVEDKARVLKMADVAIRAELEGKEDALLACLKLGCGCAAFAPQKRPSTNQVVQELDKVSMFSSPYF